jgi:hypothetical protein
MKQADKVRAAAASSAAAPRTSWLDEIDSASVVRGSSAGFTVLVLGGLLAPIAAVKAPALGSFALVLTAVIGFATAAARQRGGPRPVIQGSLAAVGAYFLVLPLVVMANHGWDPVQIAWTSLTAVVVGAATAPLAGRIRRIRFGA